MTKPVEPVVIASLDGKTNAVPALFDTGAKSTILRGDCVPAGASVTLYPAPRRHKTAAQGGSLTVIGGIILVITIGTKRIHTDAFVSPDLARELIIGSGTMQRWDITIRNQNGETKVVVGASMDDPDELVVE